MRYVVTGGCGFIGSHLVDRLLADGHSVRVLDNLSTGKRENLPAKAELIVGDVTAPGVFDALVGEADGIFHLAAVVSVQQSNREWLLTHEVNLGGCVALLDTLARKQRKIPVVFASSAAVYGDNPNIPLQETQPCAPLSPYGADKLACEYHAGVATRTHGIPTIGLRFFNVYGPRQDPHSAYSGVISIFAHAMKRNQPVTIYGDGTHARDFIYVGDVVEGLLRAMSVLETGALAHHIVNLCTGTPTSIGELAAAIAALTASRSAITHAPARPDDIRVSTGAPQLCQQLLGFKASVLLRDGLERTLGAL